MMPIKIQNKNNIQQVISILVILNILSPNHQSLNFFLIIKEKYLFEYFVKKCKANPQILKIYQILTEEIVNMMNNVTNKLQGKI